MEVKETLPSKLLHLIAEGTSDGIGIAVALHCQQNRVPIAPTDKSKAPIDDLVLLIAADYEVAKVGYPFAEQSVKKEIDAVVNEYMIGIQALFIGDEPESVRFSNTKKLVTTIVCGQVLEFLEPKKAQVKELMEKIRNEGFGPDMVRFQ